MGVADPRRQGSSLQRAGDSPAAARLNVCRQRQSYQELFRGENASNSGVEHVEEEIQGLFHAF